MKSLYRRQFAMMAAVILVAFLLLGGAFALLSYQYIVQDKQDSMERNANYIANFTASYLTSSMASGIQDPGYQLYIASLANISGSTVLLAENSGEIVYASSGMGENVSALLSGMVPGECMNAINSAGSYSGHSSLDGLLPDKSFVTGVPIRQSSYITGNIYQRGVVLVVSGAGRHLPAVGHGGAAAGFGGKLGDLPAADQAFEGHGGGHAPVWPGGV